ncbi:hypothetical protein [Scytonema sp. PRP1]|uniref:hypothetical protein n=1 Tax=Scytonema sp. PRP1 TaxID=3120513 RepID=UPI002FCEF726
MIIAGEAGEQEEKEALNQTVARVLADLDIVNLIVIEPPVEEIVGRIFQAGIVN